jgi:hypothetical protein
MQIGGLRQCGTLKHSLLLSNRPEFSTVQFDKLSRQLRGRGLLKLHKTNRIQGIRDPFSEPSHKDGPSYS